MQGLIDRAIEEYLRVGYGDELARRAAAPRPGAGPQVCLGQARAALAAVAGDIGKPPNEMLEDLGAWLTRLEPVRRLLRFSGRDFRDFLLSLQELPGRAELVLPSLCVPRLQARGQANGVCIHLLDADLQWQHVLVGLIRGMADDYGALCLICCEEGKIRVDIWEEQFAEGRQFSLQAPPTSAAAGTQ